jgi:hypothetical protein
VEGQPGVDDVLDNDDVPVLDTRIQVLDEPDRRRPTGLVGRVAGELDEVDVVQDPDRARQVGEEDEARLQQADQEQLALCIVRGDLLPDLRDPAAQVLRVEEYLADAGVVRGQSVGYEGVAGDADLRTREPCSCVRLD